MLKKLKDKKKDSYEDKEMSFLDHIDELRRRIICSLIGIVVGCSLVGLKLNFVVEEILLRPAQQTGIKLQNLQPFGQPFLYFKVLIIGGIIISMPFILYQLWKFIAPGLYPNERKWARMITFWTSICFLAGSTFAYYVMIPFMLNFSAYFGTKEIENRFDVNHYFGFVTMMILASGIIFEMPMLSYVFSRFGLVTSKLMRKYRRHSIIVILIISAVLTPTPDPINQLIFASPLFILFEISIIVAKLVERKKLEKNENEITNE